MNLNRHLREQIDACRPGSDDLALPELAELAALAKQDRVVAAELSRSQRFDQNVAVALHELPVPEGLVERLLAATAADAPVPAATGQRWTRRNWMVLAGSLAAALLLAVAAWQLRPRTPLQVSREELSLAVAQWADERKVPQATWQTSAPLPARFAIPGAINRRAPARWRSFSIAGRWSGSGVAMHFTAPTRPRAMLFVVSSPARFGVPSAPTTLLPVSGLGGMKAVAWQSPKTKLLYVLLVDEDGDQHLHDFLRSTPQA